jgi:hypothetical protein
MKIIIDLEACVFLKQSIIKLNIILILYFIIKMADNLIFYSFLLINLLEIG